MIRDTSRLPTRKEIQAQKDLLSAPIDFDGLTKAGVLEKKGAWYVVKDMTALPGHVQAQISSIQTSKPGQMMVKSRRGAKSI
jgi:hypothetical protein